METVLYWSRDMEFKQRCYFIFTDIIPPTASVGFVLLDVSPGDPISPLIYIPSAASLWVAAGS